MNSALVTYNGLGQRVGKADSTGTFSYTLEDDAIDSSVLSDGAATYIHGNGLISEVRGSSSPVSKYYYPDERGINRTLCTTNTADRREYDPFGQLIGSGNSGPTATPFGFGGQAGYQSDADTGLMLLGHRYYDASTGRFISRDPIQDGDNWYTYCENDPVNAVDPTGLQDEFAPGGGPPDPIYSEPEYPVSPPADRGIKPSPGSEPYPKHRGHRWTSGPVSIGGGPGGLNGEGSVIGPNKGKWILSFDNATKMWKVKYEPPSSP